MKTIKDALKQKKNGLYYGNRVLMPFQAYILKVIIDDEILMDLSPSSKQIYVNDTPEFTEIYFKSFKDIKDVVSKYETIKLIAVDKEDDLFDPKNHFKLVLTIGDKHNLKIEETDEDILFIE
jgi:hypothetical protein